MRQRFWKDSWLLLLIAGMFLAVVDGSSGQREVTPYAQPVAMPADRAKDSYEIYAFLLKSGPVEGREWKRKQWLIQGTTKGSRLDSTCGPATAADPPGMNHHWAGDEPYVRVTPPAGRKAEWQEVLADYDKHCHEVIQLDAKEFRADLPARLMTSEEKDTLWKNYRNPPAEYAEGAGVQWFSGVYFNPSHTLAVVEQGITCYGLCGMFRWVVLEKRDDHWKLAPFGSSQFTVI